MTESVDHFDTWSGTSGFGTGALAVSDLMCPETAASTADCSYGTDPACQWGEAIVHLSCPAPTGSFTFAFGAHRLLLATNTQTNVTGTVCNDNFNQATAVEICKLSGVASPTNVQWWTQSNYLSYPVVLESVSCPAGSTTAFSDCTYSQNTDCTNLEAIAINCGSDPLQVEFSLGSGGILWAAASGLLCLEECKDLFARLCPFIPKSRNPRVTSSSKYWASI